MVLETLVFSPFNHLTRLVTREAFIIVAVKAPVHTHYIINSITLQRRCHVAVPVKGECISRVGASVTEGDTCTSGKSGNI
jgi:hypothetical protein